MNCLMVIFFSEFLKSYGNSKSVLRAVGGRNAEMGEFPFVVRLEAADGEIFCTGSALTKFWVLTAGHCTVSEVISILCHKTCRGRYNNYFPDIEGEISDLISFIPHPTFTFVIKEVIVLANNDLGLVKTKEMYIYKVAKLSSLDFTNLIGQEAFLVGYGLTNATGNPKPLQVLQGMLIKCMETTALLHPSLCLAPVCNELVSSTGGDSGGPIVHKSGLIGITSLGDAIYDHWRKKLVHLVGFPAVYINVVSPYLNWISYTIEKNDVSNHTDNETKIVWPCTNILLKM